jgi:hypothetical protein
LDLSSLGRPLTVMGLLLGMVGGLLWLAGRLDVPFGRLPGDIRIETDGFSCVVPIVSMTLLSALLTIVLNIALRLLGR